MKTVPDYYFSKYWCHLECFNYVYDFSSTIVPHLTLTDPSAFCFVNQSEFEPSLVMEHFYEATCDMSFGLATLSRAKCIVFWLG